MVFYDIHIYSNSTKSDFVCTIHFVFANVRLHKLMWHIMRQVNEYRLDQLGCHVLNIYKYTLLL